MKLAHENVFRRSLAGILAMLLLLGSFGVLTFAADVKPIRTEAEDFTGRDGGNGVTVEEDAENGITFVGSMDETDAVVYSNIDFGDGVSSMKLHAKAPEATTLEIRLDRKNGPLAATVEIPGGDTWTEIETTLEEVRDLHDLLMVPMGEMALDWFECNMAVTLPKSTLVDAVNYAYYSGNGISTTTEGDGNVYVGHLGVEDTMMWEDVDFMTGCSKMTIRYGGGDGATLKLVLDSPTGIEIVEIYPTPGLKVETVNIKRTVGKHNIYVKVTGEVQLDYMEFIRDTEDTVVGPSEDEEIQQKEQTAVQERMGYLGIMIGDEGGFRPNDPVKRSEFCKIVACMIGMDAAAQSTTPVQIFDDVMVEHWAANYIKFMYDMGVVAGMGDGTFLPDGSVTYEQAIKMILCVLNFHVDAEEKGGYPYGYIVVADEIGVTDGEIEGATNVPATRGVIAQIVDNALEADMLVKRMNNGKETYVKAGYNTAYEANLMSDNIKAEKYEAVATKIGAEKVTFSVGDKAYSTGKDANKTASYSALPSVIDALTEGVTCSIYVKDGTVFKVDTQQYDIKYDYIYAVNGDTTKGASYDPANVTSMTLLYEDETYSVDSNAVMVFNGAQTSAAPLVGAFAKLSVDGSTIGKAEIFALNEGGIITDVRSTGLTFLNGDMYGADLQSYGNADNVLVVIDREIATLEDLAPDMTMDFYKSSEDLIIVASSDMQYGEVSGYTDDAIIVNGYEYEFDDSYSNGYYYSFNAQKNFEPIASYSGDMKRTLLKRTITLYAAPNGCVRYIWARDNESTFLGVIEKFYADDENYITVYNLSDRTFPKATYKVNIKSSRSAYEFEDLESAVGMKTINSTRIKVFTVNADGVIDAINDPTSFGETAFSTPFPNIGTQSVDFGNGTPVDPSNATYIALDNGLNKLQPRILSYNNELVNRQRSNVVMTAMADEIATVDQSVPKYVFILDGMETIGLSNAFAYGVITETNWNTEQTKTIQYYTYDGVLRTLQMQVEFLANAPERGIINYYSSALVGGINTTDHNRAIVVHDGIDLSEPYPNWVDGTTSADGNITLHTNMVVSNISSNGDSISFAGDVDADGNPNVYSITNYSKFFEMKDMAGEPMVKADVTNIGRNSVVSTVINSNDQIVAIFYTLED